MPAVRSLVRLAAKFGPVLYEGGRRAYAKLEPQVRAFLLAEKVDGYLVEWPASEGTYVFVLDRRARRVVDGFPHPAPHLHDQVLAADPSRRTHHRDHWLHQVRERAAGVGERVRHLGPGRG